jgi:hypothetical protein
MDDIQGIAAPGFFKPHQMLLGVRYSRETADIVRLKRRLSALAVEVATAGLTLEDRRGHRKSSGSDGEPRQWPPLVAIAFSFQGLFDLTPGASAIPSVAFKNGLARRSALLGDPD